MIVSVDTFLVGTAVDEVYALDRKVWVYDSGDNADVRRPIVLVSSVATRRLLRPTLSYSHSGEGSQSNDDELHIFGEKDRGVDRGGTSERVVSAIGSFFMSLNLKCGVLYALRRTPEIVSHLYLFVLV